MRIRKIGNPIFCVNILSKPCGILEYRSASEIVLSKNIELFFPTYNAYKLKMLIKEK